MPKSCRLRWHLAGLGPEDAGVRRAERGEGEPSMRVHCLRFVLRALAGTPGDSATLCPRMAPGRRGGKTAHTAVCTGAKAQSEAGKPRRG